MQVRGLLGVLIAITALTSNAAAKPIAVNGSLDGKPIGGTVERVRQTDGTFRVRVKLENGMAGEGTHLGAGLWKITLSPASSEPSGTAVGLRGKLLGEVGKAGAQASVVAKPLTLLLTKRGKAIRVILQREGKPVGSLTRSTTRTSMPTTSNSGTAMTEQPTTGLLRFADSDQRLGAPAATSSASTSPTPSAFDSAADVALMAKVFEQTVRTMNIIGERFQHPIPVLSGLWGNTLYKYQAPESTFMDAPLGALFNRLYNKNGRYRNVKECYDQAETVLDALKKKFPSLSSGDWELGMTSKPGHYWAVARIDLSKQPGARLGYMFVHMDPWRDRFHVEYGSQNSVEWSPRF